MSKELKEIQKILRTKASEETKASHRKFVPGSEDIYGVTMPALNELAGQFKHGGFTLIKELWEAGIFEEKILALKMLGKIAKKDPEQSLRLVGKLSKNISNWAECDTMGMQSLKPIVQTHHEEIFALARKYNTSPGMWQRRLSLVLVEWYTRLKKFHPEIKKLVSNLKDDEEYYIKKAIVWINKNFAKGK